MATYDELVDLLENTPDLFDRVKMTVTHICQKVIIEPVTTPLHPQRYDWAREKIETIDEDARRIYRVFLVANKDLSKSDIENMDNSTLYSNLENILDEFILADSSN